MDKYKQKLKEWYESTAERYDTWGERDKEYSSESRPIEIRRFNELLDLIEIIPNTKILDVATGTGIYLIETLKRGGEGYGIDISRNMLKQLEKKSNKIKIKGKIIKIKEGDAHKIPFPVSFDIVTCIGMFEYCPLNVIKRFLQEIKRVLKKEGKIIIDFPNKENNKIYEFQKKERSVGHEIYIYDKDKLITFLNKNGFKILKYHNASIEIQFLLALKNEI